MNRHVELGPADRDDSRPFAHPEHNAADVAALAIMAATLGKLLREDEAAQRPYDTHELRSPQGRRLRVIVNRPEALHTPCDLPIVGFFGHRRPVVSAELVADKDSIDLELISSFRDYPDVLAYCSMALDDSDYGNLVVMERPEANAHWNTNGRHAYAARVIAPEYYTCVRLHNGTLPGGLYSGQAPVLLRTKYYDYTGDWHWAAVRQYPQEP